MTTKNKDYDAVVIGAGPNGYAAAISLAERKYKVLLLEGKDIIGGGLRTQQLTLPGFNHDVCSTLHPLGAASHFFNSIPLKEHGLKWVHPPVYLAHPFDNGSASVLLRSVENTAELLDDDKDLYIKIIKPLTSEWTGILKNVLGPLHIPQNNIFTTLRFSFYAVRANDKFIKKFNSYKTKALFTGLAAHGVVPTDNIFTTAVGLILGVTAHTSGWPYAEGGSASLAGALDSYFHSLGGEVRTDFFVSSFNEIPASEVILFNTSPQSMMKILGEKLSGSYRNKLKKFEYGPAAYKIDFVLSDQVPFRNEYCRQSGFVHIGGSHQEIIASEQEVFNKRIPDKPFVLFAQPTLFDSSRAPEGKHIAYAYCHVPNGSNINMDEKIIAQIERFAPGFRDTIITYSSITPSGFEVYNPNYVGGDINGGMQSRDQLFTRPVKKLNPYKTSAKGIYICSSSTPPGGGVHGLCGYNAALSAEKYLKKLKV